MQRLGVFRDHLVATVGVVKENSQWKRRIRKHPETPRLVLPCGAARAYKFRTYGNGARPVENGDDRPRVLVACLWKPRRCGIVDVGWVEAFPSNQNERIFPCALFS